VSARVRVCILACVSSCALSCSCVCVCVRPRACLYGRARVFCVGVCVCSYVLCVFVCLCELCVFVCLYVCVFRKYLHLTKLEVKFLPNATFYIIRGSLTTHLAHT